MMITQVISSMTVTLCMLIDSIVIGRFLGVDAMAAYGYTQPVLLAFAAPGAMISAGIQVVCGNTLGSGDRDETDSCFTVSVALTALISVLGLAAVLIFSGPICTLLGAGKPGAQNPVYYLTKDYLTGFIIGVPAFLTAQIMVPYLQMSGRRMRLVSAVLVMTILDIAFDLINVLLIHGGIFGMGLASSLSYYAAIIVAIGYFTGKDCLFRLRKKGLSLAMLRRITGGGVPTVINQLSLVLLILLINNLLKSTGGNDAVAAYSVISTISNLCYAFCNGISSVALMMASIFYADEDRTSLYDLVDIMRRSAIVVLAAVTVFVIGFARPIVALFLDNEPETAMLAASGLRLFSLCLIPCALNTTFKFYYQGIERVRLMELICVLQNFALPAMGAVLLSMILGTTGIWLCFLFGEGAALLFICIYVWKQNRRVSLSVKDFALVPASLGVAPENCLECKVNSIDDAVETSKRAIDFYLAHGVDKNTSNLIGLCIEEMTCNIVTHGFPKGRPSANTIEIRLLIRDDKKIISIRDNCIGFDPIHYHELHRDDDPIAHIGIRVVVALAKEAVYVNTFGLNNLMLHL
ncbi:MAG: ATP-binding protein [Lachnospiraceae bacterium]|nr:ATP-binding protein [Lachnospiraceae bacterium]